MHGHGDKPYLCQYDDCDRAVLGNGFPRRWNLQDHMKRVHDYTGPPTNGRNSPAISDASNPKARKSKTSRAPQSTAMKRSKPGPVSKTNAKTMLAQKQKQIIQHRWDDDAPQHQWNGKYVPTGGFNGLDNTALNGEMHDTNLTSFW